MISAVGQILFVADPEHSAVPPLIVPKPGWTSDLFLVTTDHILRRPGLVGHGQPDQQRPGNSSWKRGVE